MKIGIVGMGAVGAATAMAIVLSARVQQVVLVNRNRARAKGIATDLRYGVPLGWPIEITEGDYGDLADAKVVIIAAGVNERTGGATNRDDPAGRLRLLGPNIKVYEEIVPRIALASRNAVIVVATDPPEPLVDVARLFAGHERVIGTGTFLDSLRFRVHLAQRLGVSANSTDAHVIGEHGTSSVFLWSSATVGGNRVAQIVQQRGLAYEAFRRDVEHEVRYANISIIEGIGASQYGIGMVAARIAHAVAFDERAVFPVGSFNPLYGVTVSLPSVVGREGVREVLRPEMSDDETRALGRSADILRTALAQFHPAT